MSKLLSYVVFSFTILTTSFAFNEKDTVCPVSGEKIKGSKIKAEYKKGSVSFCTESCKMDFTKNSKKEKWEAYCVNRWRPSVIDGSARFIAARL